MSDPNPLARRGVANGSAAEVSIKIGERVAFDARVTSAGLLSVGALVSGILLSTAVIVFVAGPRRSRRPLAPPSAGPTGSDRIRTIEA